MSLAAWVRTNATKTDVFLTLSYTVFILEIDMLENILSLILLGLGVQLHGSHPSILGVETIQNNIASQLVSTSESSSSGIQMPVLKRTKQEIQKEREQLEEIKLATEADHVSKRDAYKKYFAAIKGTGDYKKTISKLREYHSAESLSYASYIKARMNRAAIDSEERLLTYSDVTVALKDATKRTKVETIESNITSLIQKRRDNMLNIISKMEIIWIENTAQVLERANGKDTAAYLLAAEQALSNLFLTKEDVAEIAGKSYVIQLTSVGHVKSDVQSSVNAAVDDVVYTHKMIRNARVVMSNMIRERAKVLGEPIPLEIIK